MARMYHPNVGTEIDVPDDDDCIAVHAEAGWEPAPEPEARPGYEPDPTRYEPVTTEDKPDDDLEALRDEYRARFGEPADGRWGAQRLRDELAAEVDDPDEADA